MSNDQWDKDQRATAWDKDQGAAAWNPGQGETPSPSNDGDWNQGGDSSTTQNWDQSTPQSDPSQGQQQGGAWAASPGQAQHQPGQTQPSASGWTSGAQPQASAGDWTSGAQQQPSADQWQGEGQQWQPQGQQSAQDWNQGQQDWNQGAQGQQDWNQNPQNQFAPSQQHAALPARPSSGLGNIFDFSFRKFALPEASGAIYLIVVISAGLWFLTDIIAALFYGVAGLGLVINSLIRTILIILTARVLLEGLSASVRREKQEREIEKS